MSFISGKLCRRVLIRCVNADFEIHRTNGGVGLHKVMPLLKSLADSSERYDDGCDLSIVEQERLSRHLNGPISVRARRA